MRLENALEFLKPLGPETGALLFSRPGHGDNQVGGGVVVKEALLEFRGVFVNLNFICHGFRLAQAPKERVQGVKVLHHEHIVHGYIHDVSAGCAYGVVRVPEIGCHLDPMRRHRPQLCRPAGGVPLHDKIPLAFQQEVNFLQPPDGCRGKLVQRVRVLPEVQKTVLLQLTLFPVVVYYIELPGRKRQVRGDLLHHCKPRAF